MKAVYQVFCKCGKGRSFIQTSGTKAKVAKSAQEFRDDLQNRGWSGINLDSQSAEQCNICNIREICRRGNELTAEELKIGIR